mgnify:CR=1 FL=1
MLEKLEKVETRYEEVQLRLCDPEIVTDQAQYKKLMQEAKRLAPIVEKYRQFKAARDTFQEAKALLDAGGLDKEFHDMVFEELEQARAEMERTQEELKVLLLPRDPNDEKNVIVEIRGGAGGEEAALFAGSLLRMYSMYAEAKGWKAEILSANETELGGFKEVSFMIEGEGAYSRLKFESGVHRVQRVPETESGGRIHTSAATVAVMPEVDDVEVEINPNDLRIDTYRAGGAGGQHVNRTDSAVRITHIPTGIVVQCQNERSQIQNREQAMAVLRARLVELRERENQEKMSEIKGELKKIEWGSQIRSYVFQPYTMVKDHRTGFESGNINAVMDGEIDPFINAYLKAASQGEI